MRKINQMVIQEILLYVCCNKSYWVRVKVMVFNAIFNNISVISRLYVILEENVTRIIPLLVDH